MVCEVAWQAQRPKRCEPKVKPLQESCMSKRSRCGAVRMSLMLRGRKSDEATEKQDFCMVPMPVGKSTWPSHETKQMKQKSNTQTQPSAALFLKGLEPPRPRRQPPFLFLESPFPFLFRENNLKKTNKKGNPLCVVSLEGPECLLRICCYKSLMSIIIFKPFALRCFCGRSD